MRGTTGEAEVLVCAGQRPTGRTFHPETGLDIIPRTCPRQVRRTPRRPRAGPSSRDDGGRAGRLRHVKRLHSGGYIAGAALAGLAISACSTMSPIQTSESYNPGDGVPASSGPVTARDLLVVADQKGGRVTCRGPCSTRATPQSRSASRPGRRLTRTRRRGRRSPWPAATSSRSPTVTFPSMPAAPALGRGSTWSPQPVRRWSTCRSWPPTGSTSRSRQQARRPRRLPGRRRPPDGCA